VTLERFEGHSTVKVTDESKSYSKIISRNTVSHCNMTLLLSCDHIVVDDCDLDTYNGRSYYTEYAWKQDVLSKKELQ